MSNRGVALAFVGAMIFVAGVILAPLAVYTTTLAFFGLPHVLSELRYVDRRFGRQIDRRFLIGVATLLAIVVVVRSSVVFDVLSSEIGAPLELLGVALSALFCFGGNGLRRGLALFVAGAIGVGAATAPFAAFALLAILHNLTPLGFFWQLAPSAGRRRIMAAAIGGFVIAPLVVATGWPRAALESLLGGLAPVDPFGAGLLSDHLRVYVPPQFTDASWAVDLFSASVAAQGAHYLSVIVILPMLLQRVDPSAAGLVARPEGRLFVLLCAGVTALGLLEFFSNFAQARAVYGIVASIHAWIEIPVLITALTAYDGPLSQRPIASDPELATSDASIARSMRN